MRKKTRTRMRKRTNTVVARRDTKHHQPHHYVYTSGPGEAHVRVFLLKQKGTAPPKFLTVTVEPSKGVDTK